MNILARIVRRLRSPSETIDGYEHPELVDVVFRKTLAYKAEGEWPEMASASSVLDFGGGCGLHYKQANSRTVRWAVVETPSMIARARELATDRLRFFSSIGEAADWLGPINVMHSNGALQYTPNPESLLRELCALRAGKMLWQRVWLGDHRDVQTSFLGDNGPGSLNVREKLVRYERTAIPERDFLEAHHEYSLAERKDDTFKFILSPAYRSSRKC